ncbi:probable serine/threonine-protein kinase PBL10 isoform X2 [Mercurialis annua]|uniref:probable serine/threonine-protein kinase PBL10 isoform X2 n=1 Tax=Mercurialis annua TaxID=3986 RepID=UPI0021608C7F|nr:probable serine/threonine-protein kinase PBL10 isoform X2 [Mercurialis annua]
MGLCCSSELQSGISSAHYDTRASNDALSTTLPSIREIEGEILTSPNLKIFSYTELETATENFPRENVLGKGGFGRVFKGSINEHSLQVADKSKTGMKIAVKMLQPKGSQGQQEWLAEIKYLGQLCHPNLVKLMGYCIEQDHRLLVYEFMPNGSLERQLYGRDTQIQRQPLSWDLRKKIALGTARGLAFLHNVAKVIHRDLKSSSILLDSDFNAKISGFGFAKDRPYGKSHVSTSALGTIAYAAPEFTNTGHVTTKSDVYSFGVVLLELISGRPATDMYQTGPDKDKILVEWFLTNKRRSFEVIDVYLEGNYALTGARKAAILVTQCLSHSLGNRPNMEEVIKTLEQL